MGRIMKFPNTILVFVFSLLGIIVLVFGFLDGIKGDLQSYTSFVGPMVSTLLALLVVTKQLEDVKAKSDENHETIKRVEKQTNGQLDAKLNNVAEDIKTHVDNVVKEDGDVG